MQQENDNLLTFLNCEETIETMWIVTKAQPKVNKALSVFAVQ